MTTENQLERALDALWEAVINLSLPATSQLEILAAIGDSSAIDELALDFDDNFWSVQLAFDQNLLTRSEYTALAKLNAKLNDISGSKNTVLWTPEMLKHDNRWIAVRKLAKVALKERQISRLQSSIAS